ncbi:MAG: hypothetical protein H6502_02695 [Candidatus Woesearchaeota archaeon]|nr:MAG: hypothetical protein H6502_02695 [Candidatus Woesearchaeota archaeon]
MFGKKAEMGIGTLIIFIALLLVAAVAAGVLIQTGGSLQEKALTTGDQAKGQIATNVRVVEVSATEGSDGELDFFEEIIKLSPGSNAIKLSQTLLTMNTYDRTATLDYAGTSAQLENAFNGYYTLGTETLSESVSNETAGNFSTDWDQDGTVDTYDLNNNGYVDIALSGGGVLVISDFNCTGASHAISYDADITTNTTYFGHVTASGTCAGNSLSGASINLTASDTYLGQGQFAVEYLQRGPNPVDGNLQTGDVIKVYYQSPRAIGEDEPVRINFIPKIGTPTLTQFITPEVVSNERVYLYP